MRGRLVHWLLTSRLLCWFGLHAWTTMVEIAEDADGHATLQTVGTHCGACETVK